MKFGTMGFHPAAFGYDPCGYGVQINHPKMGENADNSGLVTGHGNGIGSQPGYQGPLTLTAM